MNQIPEIKEGLQFTHRSGGTLYTFRETLGDTIWIEWQYPTSLTPERFPYTVKHVQDLLEKGEWITRPMLSTLFSSQPHNVVMTALEECAKDHYDSFPFQEQWEDSFLPDAIYEYLSDMRPPASEILAGQLTDKIHQLGFTIIPK